MDSTTVYIDDEQFSQLLNAINEKETHSEFVQDSQDSADSSNSSDGLTEIDVLSYILLAEFIIIGILSWALVRRK